VSKVKKTASLTGVRNLTVPAPEVKPLARAAAPARPARAPAKVSAKASTRRAAKAAAPAKPVKRTAKVAEKSAKKPAMKPVRATKQIATKISKKSTPKTAPRRTVRGMKKAVKKATAKVAAKTKKTLTLTVVRGRNTGRPGRLEPIARYAIKPLDPLRKCGPETSVQFLYRVDESVEGRTTPHLVFFDRHGWYCEHGRTCPAVAQARKYNGHIARVS
jgi:hypothetical protein